MGVDSVAIVVRWLVDPSCRDFDLSQLVVLSAMTGDEYTATGELMEHHVLPLMREHHVRFVQVARAGQASSDGYVVLNDSRTPQRMHMRGPWAMSDEMTSTGTVPQIAGDRRCSARAKGEVLDGWLADAFAGRRYRHVIGYAAEETRRAARDTTYTAPLRRRTPTAAEAGLNADCADPDRLAISSSSRIPLTSAGPWSSTDPLSSGATATVAVAASAAATGLQGALRVPEYPLIEWGWDRRDCEDFLRTRFGTRWSRSCCTYCPYQASGPRGIADLMQRWQREPAAAVAALVMEHRAMALNERSLLFGRRAAIDIVREHHLTDILTAYHDAIITAPWSVYEVRRILHARAGDPRVRGVGWRSVRVRGSGPRLAMQELLHDLAGEATSRIDVDGWGIPRARLRQRDTTYPTVEHFHALAPAGARDKERPGFAAAWNQLVAAPQPALF